MSPGSSADRTSEGEADRVLVVEDEFLLALFMEDEMTSWGYQVVGPTGSIHDALDLVDETLSAALLDINLGGELVTPVARRLTERGIPFGFLTAYSDTDMLPTEFQDAPCFKKPLRGEELAGALRTLLAPRSG